MATFLSSNAKAQPRTAVPHGSPGRFGVFGGRYVPETLMAALEELERAYFKARKDKSFQRELDYLLRNYAGRPTSLYFARRLSRDLGGAKIYLKREDLLHTGAHKINNCVGQALLAAHPYPLMVRDFHSVIGREARAQIMKAEGKLPRAIIACVGGGSNAIGIFHQFLDDNKVRLIGVEAGGRNSELG